MVGRKHPGDVETNPKTLKVVQIPLIVTLVSAFEPGRDGPHLGVGAPLPRKTEDVLENESEESKTQQHATKLREATLPLQAQNERVPNERVAVAMDRALEVRHRERPGRLNAAGSK